MTDEDETGTDGESSERGTARLRIGVLASIAHRTPPRDYGPWEQVASTLTEGLVALGHDVTLFATADSLTAARLRAEAPRGYEEDPGVDAKVYEGLHNAAAFERAAEFDVLSNHFDFLPLTYSRLVTTPVVTTIHGFSSERIVPVYRAYDDIAHYVAISDADRHPELTYDATIHHGIDLSAFTFRDQPGSYLLFLGRIHPTRELTTRSRSPGGSGCRSSSPEPSRTRTTSAPWSSRTSRSRASATRARSGPANGMRCSVARSRCCTSSASPNRSCSRSSKHWPAAPR